MADAKPVEIQPLDYIDDHIAPFFNLVGLGAVVAPLKLALQGGPFPLPVVLPEGFDPNAPLTVLLPDLFEDLRDAVIPEPAPGQTAAPPLAPVDPQAALTAIANAFKEAESRLNLANLAIGTASAEVSLKVDVLGAAGADAVLKLSIGPTPRG